MQNSTNAARAVDEARPRISLVLTTYNRAGLLTVALDSIARSRIDGAEQVEIIVVDNNSTDDTSHVVREVVGSGFPFALHYVLETKQGLSHARNAGIGSARGDYIAFMDDDQMIDADYFARIVPAFEKTKAACVGGPVFYAGMDKLPSWLIPLLERTVKSPPPEDVRCGKINVWTSKNRDYVVGGNMIVRRDVLREVGGFDANLGRRGEDLLAAEDVELQDRLYDFGQSIAYYSGLVQYHYVHPDRCTRRYWRRRLFFHGRTVYMHRLAARFASARRLFRAPRWLWWCLLTQDVPAFIGTRLARGGYRRFDRELAIWQRAGQIYQARLESRGQRKVP